MSSPLSWWQSVWKWTEMECSCSGSSLQTQSDSLCAGPSSPIGSKNMSKKKEWWIRVIRQQIILLLCQRTRKNTAGKSQYWLHTDTLECFVRHAVAVAAVTDRALFTGAFWKAVEDEMVTLLEEEDEEEGGGKAVDCCGGGAEVEAALLFRAARCDALPRCVLSCFPVDPPPFCAGLCLTTFSSSIWVSSVPCARPKSTRANLGGRERSKILDSRGIFKIQTQPVGTRLSPTIKATLLTFFCSCYRGNCLVWCLGEWFQTGGCVSELSASGRCRGELLQSSLSQWCPDNQVFNEVC